MKKVAILQSNYIPWKGYFDMIAAVDEFILYDDVQYTKNDWRNRNKIKTSNGIKWITIPIMSKGCVSQSKKINEITIAEKDWAKKHWSLLNQTYKNAPYYLTYEDTFKSFFNASEESFLSMINYRLIIIICKLLNINTPISWSSDYILSSDRNYRLVELCKQAQATHYLSGPAAQSYLDKQLFNENGIEVEWMDYSDYPEYPQLYGNYVHEVSVLDLLFNCGRESPKYMKYVN